LPHDCDPAAWVTLSPLPAVALDRQGIVRALNEAAARCLRVDAALMPGQALGLWTRQADRLAAFLDGGGGALELPFLVSHAEEVRLVVHATRAPAADLLLLIDVTEQRLSEARLDFERQRFLDFVGVSGTSFFEIDPTLTTLRSWRKAEADGEATVAERIVRFPEEGFDLSFNKAGMDEAMGRFRTREPVTHLLYRMARLDGGETYRVANSVPIYDAAGTFCGHRGVTVDVTDQILAERALSQAREHLSHAQRVAATGSSVRDLATGALRWSDEMFHLAGVDQATFEPTDDNIFDLVHEEDRARMQAFAMMIRSGIQPPPTEFRMRRADGQVHAFYCETDMIADAEGTPLRAVTVFKDVTALRTAERRRAEMERHLAHAQRLAAIGSIERDLESGAVSWSDEMLAIIGLERKDAPAERPDLLRYVHPEDAIRVRRAVERAHVGKRTRPGEFRIVRPDGEVRMIYTETAVDCDHAGKPVRLLSIFKDVTDERAAAALQRDTQQQLLHAQKMDALGTLAGGVAHELNNTLVPVLALTKMVANELPADSRGRAHLDIVLRASHRARDLVRQILAFSRKEQPRLESVDLAEVLGHSLRMLRASLPASIRIEERIAPVPPLTGDAVQMGQVIVNLVTNAAQAIGQAQGRIEVTLEPGGDGEARITVADTGCGMAEAVRARIFEPFYTTKGVGQGTGLGLAIVHGIVRRHAGRIAVDSAPGRGTRFEIVLPVGPSAAAIEAPAA
jgi:PAS domain S-box-containing protein